MSTAKLRLHAPARRLAAGAIALLLAVGPPSAMGQASTEPQSAAAGVSEPADGHKPKGRQWAILIGIEKYHSAARLRFTVNDVRLIGETLRVRCGYSVSSILELTDLASDSGRQPLRSSILAAVPEWLAKAGPDDTMLVYFSGHGFRDAAGQMYLAPIDCDPSHADATGIPIAWLREQVAACRAGVKLVVLDACHAGSEKAASNDPAQVEAGELGKPLEDLEGVVTLASSKADQKSQIWDEMQQSLFSYWLRQGLKGHADANGDGAVDIDELYKYVHRNVDYTASVRFPRPQTPVRIVRSGTVGVPVVARLVPQRLPVVLADMAEQLAIELGERRLSPVGVVEFTDQSELRRQNFGNLGKWCAAQIEEQLFQLGRAHRFSVVDSTRLQHVLAQQRFAPRDLGAPGALQRLSAGIGKMPVLVVGNLRGRSGNVVSLQCKLITTDSAEPAAVVGGAAVISASDWAMFGRSAAVSADDYRVEAPHRPDQHHRPLDEQIVARLDERAQAQHPLKDASFPFRVKIMVGGKERPGTVRGNDYFVPLRKDDVYEIWVENHSGQLALMRLLVDGLNTLPQPDSPPAAVQEQSALAPGQFAADSSLPVPMSAEAIIAARPKGIATQSWAQRVHLEEARHWYLDPTLSTVYAVRGFVSHVEGRRSKLYEFKVVDAGQSLAGKQRFTDQIGLITVAFYAPGAPERAAYGTGVNELRGENIRHQKERFECGNLLGVVNIRYVPAEDLDALARQ